MRDIKTKVSLLFGLLGMSSIASVNDVASTVLAEFKVEPETKTTRLIITNSLGSEILEYPQLPHTVQGVQMTLLEKHRNSEAYKTLCAEVNTGSAQETERGRLIWVLMQDGKILSPSTELTALMTTAGSRLVTLTCATTFAFDSAVSMTRDFLTSLTDEKLVAHDQSDAKSEMSTEKARLTANTVIHDVLQILSSDTTLKFRDFRRRGVPSCTIVSRQPFQSWESGALYIELSKSELRISYIFACTTVGPVSAQEIPEQAGLTEQEVGMPAEMGQDGREGDRKYYYLELYIRDPNTSSLMLKKALVPASSSILPIAPSRNFTRLGKSFAAYSISAPVVLPVSPLW